jgi:hypothetical protein
LLLDEKTILDLQEFTNNAGDIVFHIRLEKYSCNFGAFNDGSIYAQQGIIANWEISHEGFKKSYYKNNTYTVMMHGALNPDPGH